MDVFKEAGKKVAMELSSKLSGISSDYYERTGELIESFRNPKKIRIGSQGVVSFSIFDESKIISSLGEKGKFNHHMSLDGSNVYRGTPIREMVPLWMNDGFKLPNGKINTGLRYLESALGGQSTNEFVEKKFIENAFDNFAKEILQLTKGGF